VVHKNNGHFCNSDSPEYHLEWLSLISNGISGSVGFCNETYLERFDPRFCYVDISAQLTRRVHLFIFRDEVWRRESVVQTDGSNHGTR
jgi:hypothetical protein